MKSIILNKRIKWKRRLFLFTFCRRCGFARDAEVISQPALLMPAIIIRYYNKYWTIGSCRLQAYSLHELPLIRLSHSSSYYYLTFHCIHCFECEDSIDCFGFSFHFASRTRTFDGERTVDWILLENRIVCWRIVALKCSSWFLRFVQLCARRLCVIPFPVPQTFDPFIHFFFIVCVFNAHQSKGDKMKMFTTEFYVRRTNTKSSTIETKKKNGDEGGFVLFSVAV